MGMTEPTQDKTPEPKYPNMLVCPRCRAEFSISQEYHYGRLIGTSTQFVRYGTIKQGQCPVCMSNVLVS